MFLGYARNGLGTYFNLLVWIGALRVVEHVNGWCFLGMYNGVGRRVYGRMIYMSHLRGCRIGLVVVLCFQNVSPKYRLMLKDISDIGLFTHFVPRFRTTRIFNGCEVRIRREGNYSALRGMQSDAKQLSD